MHRLNETCAERNVVVLDENAVALSVKTSATSCATVATEPRLLRKKSYRSLDSFGIALLLAGAPILRDCRDDQQLF
jgi:hypothetical protein